LLQQPSHNSLWFLIARSLAGEATLGEEEAWQHVLQQDATVQQQYYLLKRMWHSKDESPDIIDEHEKENISRILQLSAIEKAATEIEEPAKEFPIRSRRRIKKLYYTISSA